MINKKPMTQKTTLTSPCPLAKWGMDILGPFPPVKGSRKFMIITIDYFIRWVKIEAMTTTIMDKVISFLWKFIISGFGIPRVLIIDNGTQFDIKKF